MTESYRVLKRKIHNEREKSPLWPSSLIHLWKICEFVLSSNDTLAGNFTSRDPHPTNLSKLNQNNRPYCRWHSASSPSWYPRWRIGTMSSIEPELSKAPLILAMRLPSSPPTNARNFASSLPWLSVSPSPGLAHPRTTYCENVLYGILCSWLGWKLWSSNGKPDKKVWRYECRRMLERRRTDIDKQP